MKPKQSQARRRGNPERQSTIFSPAGRYLGGLAGGFLGGPAGAAIGSSLGSTAGSLISKITGFGSYRVNKNTIFADSIPQFQSRLGDGSIRIRHKEFISDVISSSTPGLFNPVQFAVSASDANTFPYLSQLAVNFEEFAFEGLVFEYVTSSGSLSTTGQLGTCVGAMQFNSLAAPYVNKQQMEASTFGQSTVASQSCLFPIECDALQTPSNGIFYNSRPGIVPTNNDKRWNQLGNFTFATVGMPAASETVGELYVSYDVLLMKPILIQNSGCQADHYTATTAISGGTPYWGTDYALTSGSDNFTTLDGVDVVTIDPSFFGKIAVSFSWTGAAGLWLDPTAVAFNTGATALNILNGNTVNQLPAAYLNGTFSTWITSYWNIAPVGGIGAKIQLTGGTTSTPTNMDFIITQLPEDFN